MEHDAIHAFIQFVAALSIHIADFIMLGIVLGIVTGIGWLLWRLGTSIGRRVRDWRQ
jgi:hypothetical protein